jgi:hypothetical protein
MLTGAGRALLILALCAGTARAQQVTSEIVVHTTLAAGLAHHEAKGVWDEMRVGDAVALLRESHNPHDANAVRVEWNGHVLGYLPRDDNESVARQMDRGNRLAARVARLDRYRNHRLRLELEIYLTLQPAAR